MQRASPIILFFISLALGVAGGLAYAWFAAPVQPTRLTPAKLNPTDRDIYIRMIAAGFAADNDRETATRRLADMGPEGESELIDLIMADLRNGQASSAAEQLIRLATTLDLDAPVVDLLAPYSPLPRATAEAPSTPATPSPVPSSGPAYRLTGSEQLCLTQKDSVQLELIIEDSEGRPLPGITVSVAWPGGQNRIYTGFHPDQSAGFADFQMEPDITYSVAIAEDPPSATGLQTHLCPDGRAGGWRLTYRATGQ